LSLGALGKKAIYMVDGISPSRSINVTPDVSTGYFNAVGDVNETWKTLSSLSTFTCFLL
jgi:hypothetical protein